MDATASDILLIATKNLSYIGPALLLICSLVFADGIAGTLISIVREPRRYRP